jgi:hypothetical protein
MQEQRPRKRKVGTALGQLEVGSPLATHCVIPSSLNPPPTPQFPSTSIHVGGARHTAVPLTNELCVFVIWQALRNPGLRDRHWQQIATVVGSEMVIDDSFTLATAQERGLLDHLPSLQKVLTLYVGYFSTSFSECGVLGVQTSTPFLFCT